ncbi:uncharacterized protein FIBRA_04996 [Fibroporia radiculosa]|uniref:RecA family profile 1 domain-containing protein n=1 Tax=Fibroporia radiculosa TaxID=599839 RepID=J4HWU7_9APHY|nr:uncharacterized protein FIBRA_04996 [Fibroporia radiculosa]CCM02882.1 predicted protein [Fibroporia radiculosa]
MEFASVSSVSALSDIQQTWCRRGGVQTIADILLISSSDLANKCRILKGQAEALQVDVSQALVKQPCLLEDADLEDEMFTTGDSCLDEVLDGGIRTGMLWEIVGESAAGKTQLALQLSLSVQIPHTLGGLSGTACYLTTSTALPTSRLTEIMERHPLLSRENCSLSAIHTIKTPEIPILLHVLSTRLPNLVDSLAKEQNPNPVKLLVIDALAELFHMHDKTTADVLGQRSKHLAEISTLLHTLASKYRIAVLVLNEVQDVFSNFSYSPEENSSEDLAYHDQVRWFGRADGVPGEDRKEASLGLVWANQVNTRIMLSRTTRERVLDVTEKRRTKRRRLDGSQSHTSTMPQTTRLRCLSIIFSSIVPPTSVDYIVTAEGIAALPGTVDSNSSPPLLPPPLPVSQLSAPLSDKCPPSASSGQNIDSGLLLDVSSQRTVGAGDYRSDPDIMTSREEAENGPQLEVNYESEDYWQGDSEEEFYNDVDIEPAISSSSFS